MSAEHELQVLASFRRARVLVLGDVMLDRFVYGSVERVAPEAPVPVMALQRTVNMPGGAANVSGNAAALSGTVVLIGVVGQDEQAELRSQLSSMGSIQDSTVVDSSRPTTTKTRFIADRQQILPYKGATVLTPNKLELQAACGHDCTSDEQVAEGARKILAQGKGKYG